MTTPMSGTLDSSHAYTEYGVIVDLRSKGQGFFLAHTHRDREVAEQLAQGCTQFYPVEVMMRRVYTTDWQSLPGGTYPDSPMDLHPEAFVVGKADALPPCPYCGHHTLFRPEGWTSGYPVECANPLCETNTGDPVSD